MVVKVKSTDGEVFEVEVSEAELAAATKGWLKATNAETGWTRLTNPATISWAERAP